MYLRLEFSKPVLPKCSPLQKKGKATVIRYLVTVLRDRERRSFLHLLRSFFSSRITVHFFLFNRKWGSRECPARVISDKIWPPFAAVKVSIFEFFSCLCFYPEYFLSLFILRKPQNLKKMPILFDNI